MYTNVTWRIAGAIRHESIISQTLNHYKTHNSMRGKIEWVYDSFNNLIWNSGRVSGGDNVKLSEIERILKLYNSLNVGFSLVCSNHLLNPSHLQDDYGNQILKALDSIVENVSIIISQDCMFDYIKTNFPRFKTIHSCIPDNDNYDYLSAKQDQYDIVVLPPKANRKYNLIKRLNCDTLEILVNEYCLSDCTLRKAHYDSLSNLALNHLDNNDNYRESLCPRRTNTYDRCVSSSCLLSVLEVEKLITECGISKLKLQGRAAPPMFFLFDLIKYIADPQVNSFIFREIGSMSERYASQMQQKLQNNTLAKARTQMFMEKYK